MVVVVIVAVAPGEKTVRTELFQPNLTIRPSSIRVEQRVNCILSVKARFAFRTKAKTKIQEE